jgi:hypothetical protein
VGVAIDGWRTGALRLAIYAILLANIQLHNIETDSLELGQYVY